MFLNLYKQQSTESPTFPMKSLSSKFSNNVVKTEASIHCSKIFHNIAIQETKSEEVVGMKY